MTGQLVQPQSKFVLQSLSVFFCFLCSHCWTCEIPDLRSQTCSSLETTVMMEIQPSTEAETQFSASTKKLLGTLEDSSWAGAEVNGLGCQTQLHVERVFAWAEIRTGRLSRRQSGRSWIGENLDKVGVVLHNSSLASTDNSTRPFIFYTRRLNCHKIYIYIFLSKIFLKYTLFFFYLYVGASWYSVFIFDIILLFRSCLVFPVLFACVTWQL